MTKEELEKVLELCNEAVKDTSLTDGTVRMILLNMLNHTPPTAADIEWAKNTLRERSSKPSHSGLS